MTTAWRIVKSSRAADAFSGEGARLYGGRWNHRGTAIVYLAESLALAALELFVHLGSAHTRLSFSAFPLELPDDVIEVFDRAQLPPGWRQEPPSEATKDIGTGWAQRRSAAALKLPSAIVPVEHNYALNPAHPDFAQITIGDAAPFSFDPRMWK